MYINNIALYLFSYRRRELIKEVLDAASRDVKTNHSHVGSNLGSYGVIITSYYIFEGFNEIYSSLFC